MDLEKIYGSRGVTAALRAQHASSEKEETSDAFARILQNLRTSKAANSRDRSDAEGDTIVTRVLADGSVITQIYEGTKLVSQIVTRCSHPEQGKALVSETIEKMKRQAHEQSADPLLAARAAQSSAATAAAASAML